MFIRSRITRAVVYVADMGWTKNGYEIFIV